MMKKERIKKDKKESTHRIVKTKHHKNAKEKEDNKSNKSKSHQETSHKKIYKVFCFISI